MGMRARGPIRIGAIDVSRDSPGGKMVRDYGAGTPSVRSNRRGTWIISRALDGVPNEGSGAVKSEVGVLGIR